MTTAPERPTTRDVALMLGALDAIAKTAKTTDTAARAVAASDYLAEGERVPIVDPTDGSTLGFVARTTGATTADIVDIDALTDYLADRDPDAVYHDIRVKPGVSDGAVIDALCVFAPHLVEQHLTAKEWAVNAAKTAAAAGELSPGIEVRRKPGHITITKVTEDSRNRLRQLATTGVVDVFRALPTGDA